MKKRLDSLRIERFRQIRELSIPELGHVNLIVGGNNSGKSTVLDALRMFATRASPAFLRQLLVHYGEFVPKQNALQAASPEQALRHLFFGRKFPDKDGQPISVGDATGQRSVRLEYVWARASYVPRQIGSDASVSDRYLESVARDSGPTLAWAGANAALRVSVCDRPRPAAPVVERTEVVPLSGLFDFREYLGPLAQIEPVPFRHVSAGQTIAGALAEVWDEVVLTNGEPLALDALRIIEPQVSGLAFVQLNDSQVHSARTSDDRTAVVKMLPMENPVPLRSMGDGMTRVLHLVLYALRASDGLLLIDEFENGLHYSAQAKVWQVLFEIVRQSGLQIFATTHSNDCVRAFCEVAQKSADIDGKLLKLERMPDDGRTVAATLGEDDLSNLLDAGIEVRG